MEHGQSEPLESLADVLGCLPAIVGEHEHLGSLVVGLEQICFDLRDGVLHCWFFGPGMYVV